jgi:hypothetical protein
VLSLVLLPVAAAAPPGVAHLTVMRLSPFTMRGSGFAAGERIRVSVAANQGAVRHVIATERGGFTVRLQAVMLGECDSYFIRAVGNDGTVATMKVSPGCPRLVPGYGPPPWSPSDSGCSLILFARLRLVAGVTPFIGVGRARVIGPPLRG